MSHKGVISKTCKELIQLNIKNQTHKQSDKKWNKDLNRYFSKADTEMANRHMKRCSPSLIIREKQSKTTISYYPTPVRMTVIKQTINHKSCWGCREKERLVLCWWECQLVQLLWKAVWRFLKTLKKKNQITLYFFIQQNLL